MTEMRRADRHESPSVPRRHRHPVHPALVSVPIGAWIASLIFDVASHLVSSPAVLATGSRWLIVIGIAGAVVASAAGFADLTALPEGRPVFRTACAHMAINLTLVVVYVVNFAWRQRASAPSAPVGAGMLVLSAGCVALLVVSGFLGGRLTYRYGVRVADEASRVGAPGAGRHIA